MRLKAFLSAAALAGVLAAAPARANAPADPCAFAVRGLPLAVACAEVHGTPLAVPATVASPEFSVPQCRIPGFDDRCEAWFAEFSYAGGGEDEHTAGFDQAREIAISPDGNTIYVSGSSLRDHADQMVYTVAAFDRTGKLLWDDAYDGPGDGSDYQHGIAVSPDGASLYITGGEGTVASVRGDYATLAYDTATGARRWVGAYSYRADGIDLAYDVAVSPDGAAVYVTGQSRGDGSAPSVIDYDYATVAYDAVTGDELWVARYDGDTKDSYDAAFEVEVSRDGAHVYVGGFGEWGEYVTISYDAATGAQEWISAQGSAAGIWIVGAMTLSPDGSTIFLTGTAPSGAYPDRVNDNDPVTVALDASDGSVRWQARYGGTLPGPDGAYLLAVSPDGSRLFVGGTTSSAPRDLDFLVVAYDMTGAEMWSMTSSGPVWYDEVPRGLVVAPDGGTVYVSGENADGFTHSFVATFALRASDGARAWSARFNPVQAGISYPLPAGAVVSADGKRLYVGTTFQYLDDQRAGRGPLAGDRGTFGPIAYDL